jgi:hypothetical protein
MNEDKVEYVFDQHRSQPPQVISMTQERYEAAIAEARAAEREQCCKDVCFMCAEGRIVIVGVIPELPTFGRYFHHGGKHGDSVRGCLANAIRQRASQEH